MIINRIQVLNYGCLRYVDVPMDRFHVLIGPNASGKSTLMDAIKFVSDVVRDGVDAAVERRTANFADLVWGRPLASEDQWFEMALEFEIPDDIRTMLPEEHGYQIFRYEAKIGVDEESGQINLLNERGDLQAKTSSQDRQLSFFPSPHSPPATILRRRTARGLRNVFRKNETGRSRFNDETVQETGSVNWNPGLNISAKRSMLSILPDRDEQFPVSTRAMVYLRDKVVALALNSQRMRDASPPRMGYDLRADGSNVPWVADALLQQEPDRADLWAGHIQYALKDFKSVRAVHREEDAHKYLMVRYGNGLEVPSWKVSDGTLRLLALTLLAYLPRATGLYMIEEPENGIHPEALQSLFHSLSAVYDAQVLVATHSPGFVAMSDVKQLLCFGKTADGAVDIVSGPTHPHLQDWRDEFDLGTFFASGILA